MKTTVIEPTRQVLKTEDEREHKVCAYCRVSTDEKDQKNSLAAQKRFFDSYFSTRPNWKSLGIFADEGLSGTMLEKRHQFNAMLRLARDGGVDIILSKEVSRFSRNVQDLLNIVEELRGRGVYIWFLADDINTERNDYREKLTQSATNAEQESLRTSRRVKWGQQQQMRQGVVFGRRRLFGYVIERAADGTQSFRRVSGEADAVKKVFSWFASGDSVKSIANRLTERGVQACGGNGRWTTTAVYRILQNEKYVGDLLQGKTYTPNPLTHKKKPNLGAECRVYIENHHADAAIVNRGLWHKVQQRLAELKQGKRGRTRTASKHWAAGKVYCGLCGGKHVLFSKKQKHGVYKAWLCADNHRHGAKAENGGCTGARLNDRVLAEVLRQVLAYCLEMAGEARTEMLCTEFYQRVTKRVEVYPGGLIRLYLSFMEKSVCLRYKTRGRGDGYTVSLSALTATELDQATKKKPPEA